MDSISQIVLGAAVGQAVLGKEAGNKALLWGAVSGTIPDLDIIPRLFADTVTGMEMHRGFSHSLLFALTGPFVFGWITQKIHSGLSIPLKKWAFLFFMGIITHILLDNFTTWGTQVFYPFEYRVAWRSIFVIDPLYTLPFLGFTLAVLFTKDPRLRRKLNYMGLTISTLYLLITLINKNVANQAFEAELERQNIKWERFESNPTPFNTIFWFVNVETDSGFYAGNYSLLDNNSRIHFTYYPKNYHLLKEFRQDPKLIRLLKITRGFYTVEKTEENIVINDLRFGSADILHNPNSSFVFTYILKVDKKDPARIAAVELQRPLIKMRTAKLAAFWDRLTGKKGN